MVVLKEYHIGEGKEMSITGARHATVRYIRGVKVISCTYVPTFFP